jgi:putative hydrolase of the HAD superfamily
MLGVIKAVGFDIGHTLIYYNNPLNWSSLYRPALEQVLRDCGIACSGWKIESAISILTKYNTRVNYRETEISSDILFGEIFDAWSEEHSCFNKAKESFYGFFQADAVPFGEAEAVLSKLKSLKLKIGALTDVAYGMDNCFSLKDIEPISQYIDVVLTSRDVGFRKPNGAGFRMLLEALNVRPDEVLYVGDEEKDVVGANKLGIGSVLINRGNEEIDFGQKYTVRSLEEVVSIL